MRPSITFQVVLVSLLFLAFLRGTASFVCRNGRQVWVEWVCNGYNDCVDNSDEMVCDSVFGCHPATAPCLNEKCIPRRKFCDGRDDCGDNSDETFCEPFQCDPSAFQCLNGKCISREDFCRIGDNCEDNSDEKFCYKEENEVCPAGWFHCTQKRRCIPSTWVCDGLFDCGGEASDELDCGSVPCTSSSFQCSDEKCIRRELICNGRNDCDYITDEQYCNKTTNEKCPPGWSECPNKRRCIPLQWVCDGYDDCGYESEEKYCDTLGLIAQADLKLWLLTKRKSGSRTDRWGSQVHRIAVALHLADNKTFLTANTIGDEIREELSMRLILLLAKDKKMPLEELALYINALLAVCMDPRDFYGDDLVQELRRRVELTGNYTNPFLILVLCNAGDAMTSKDLNRVTTAFHSKQRPFWKDSQALATMAASCILSRSGGTVDESILLDMLQDLKRNQFVNGTMGSLKTTALVTQAMFIQDSYKKDFYLNAAINALLDGLKNNRSLLNVYYTLPILHQKNLLNVTSSHCNTETYSKISSMVEDEEEERPSNNEKYINVHYSIRIGDEPNKGRSWRMTKFINCTLYIALETMKNVDENHKIEYNVVEGKPYVRAFNGIEDDPEMEKFWFIYLRPLHSDKDPKLIDKSPVDVTLRVNKEIIMWYKRALWNN